MVESTPINLPQFEEFKSEINEKFEHINEQFQEISKKLDLLLKMNTESSKAKKDPILNKTDNSWPPKLPEIKDAKIRDLAFTHKSFVNGKVNRVKLSNERLEFLGDSILNHLTTLNIYQRFPHVDEGILTKTRSSIVNNKTLIEWAHLYGLENRMKSKLCLDKGKHNEKIYADLIESYIGGLYLEDDSYDRIQPWLNKLMEPLLNKRKQNPSKNSNSKGKNNKKQENAKRSENKTSNNQIKQKNGAPQPLDTQIPDILINLNAKSTIYKILAKYNLIPKYTCLSSINSPMKRMEITANNIVLGIGEASSQKKGERKAAMNALNNNKMLEYLRTTYTSRK